MSVGIDDISFYTSNFYLDLKSLADVQNIDAEKYYQGIGQEKMGIVGADEDVVTMAAAAALPLLERCERSQIDTLMFATETGVDQSKAAGVFVHGLLDLPNRCRVVELKQACYSATAAIQMACAIVARDPRRKVLVLASDIARYDLASSGEATQGCGAVAVLIGANPKLVEIAPESGRYTEDVMDFWRPNYRSTALVDGKYSTKIYLTALKQAYSDYLEQGGAEFDQLDYLCYHLPFSRMAEKAQTQLSRYTHSERDKEALDAMVMPTLNYNRIIGNSYTASIYIGLASLLDNPELELSGQRVGFFSYGSGCVSEFFSGTVMPGYRDYLHTDKHQAMLQARTELSYTEYLKFYNFECPADGGDHRMPEQTKGPFRLEAINQHKRVYSAR
ncbi:hydroxymethylglutaryl-CoA synthase [Motiliproteus coralliicola]|uniref:Hydroxymethylglutaryl-CoA synthase n=1 Tax=Motiliproteus coralliicola TaxID=2283196 RepID=A0A369WWQ3_9GAMM|nr:hydroxymethylglutaryl-CoA synthase [Motiliproteus coralliicola]RDE24974.1 hydroxymethylglutaryl-CoA synthase [Motiliproteus coralliicola]